VPRSSQSTDVVRFSAYEVNLRAGELYRAGRKIRLQIQPFHVLAMLLEHPGEVVAREELQKRLWPADTFVDFDHSLNTAIKKLRQALSDDKKKPRFIETLPKRGYRFIGTVEQAAGAPATALPSPPTPSPASAPASGKIPAASSCVGRVGKLSSDGQPDFALVSVDEPSAAEREKLDAANDDVGLSLLIAAQKLLLVANGTQVRILEMQETASRYLVRILEGEHYGKTALVPMSWLVELS
jgi:DNA-binding winged helix-turn-helix (wHTH) protein